MEKSLHMFSNKNHCRIQIVFGLCLAMLFTFYYPSYISKAANSEVHYGYFGENSQPALGISYDTSLSLSDLINLGITASYSSNTDLISYEVTYQHFIDSIQYYGLSSLLSNWQPGNPEYFLNISYCIRPATYQNSYAFCLYFAKSNGKDTFTAEPIGNNLIQFSNSKTIFFNHNLDIFLTDYCVLGTTNSYNDQEHSKNVFYKGSVYSSTGSRDGSYYDSGTSISFSYAESTNAQNILNRFTSFLNTYNIYTFSVIIPDVDVTNNDSSLKYLSNIGFHPVSGTTEYPLFSTIFSYDFGSDLSYSYYDNSYKWTYALPNLNSFSSAVIIQDKSDILSYGYEIVGGSYVTPTPIPTRYWTTPTPFPNVTFIPATLTPIVVQYDPYIYGSDDTWDNLAGYLGILNTALKSPVNRFFSTIMQVTYSFSDWFKFMLVVPIICLFAFIIGRLKRK